MLQFLYSLKPPSSASTWPYFFEWKSHLSALRRSCFCNSTWKLYELGPLARARAMRVMAMKELKEFLGGNSKRLTLFRLEIYVYIWYMTYWSLTFILKDLLQKLFYLLNLNLCVVSSNKNSNTLITELLIYWVGPLASNSHQTFICHYYWEEEG